MGFTQVMIGLLKMIEPTSAVKAQMRKDWDHRARLNARHCVATLQQEWDDHAFFESGRTWVQLYVRPDLDLICGTRHPSKLRMLEIGCGAGRMTRGFSEVFGTVDALDVSPEMIAHAREHLSDCKNVRFHVTDGSTLSVFGDGEFDFVFSAIVFQHIPRKSIIRSYIREASRVLRPGCVFTFQAEGAAVKEHHANTWHGVGFTEQEIRQMARQYGFEVHAVAGAGTQYFWITLVKQEHRNGNRSNGDYR